jgi:hypothetical protein
MGTLEAVLQDAGYFRTSQGRMVARLGLQWTKLLVDPLKLVRRTVVDAQMIALMLDQRNFYHPGDETDLVNSPADNTPVMRCLGSVCDITKVYTSHTALRIYPP